MRIDELRSVLDEHADAIHDAPQARLAPVRRRVAVARRRRMAAVAAVPLLAVVAVVLAVVPLRTGSHLPFAGAPDTLAGRAVPPTMHATGFTYRYARGYQSRAGASTLDVGVDVGTTPRLVAWASSNRSSRPVVRLTNHTVSGDPQVSGASGFGRYTLLYPFRGQQTQHLRLRQTDAGPGTRLAVAVYDLSDPGAAGVGNDRVVFRRTLAGEQLVKGVVGKPGQDDLRFRVTIPSTDLQWSGVCYGSKLWYAVTVNGHGNFGSQCRSTPDLDAGNGGATYESSPFGKGVGPGDTVDVRIHLSPDSKRSGALAADADAVLGLALYTHDGPSHVVAGTRVPDRTESGGHDWLAGAWRHSGPGERSLRVRLATSDRPRLLTWVANGLATGGNRFTVEVSPGAGRGARMVSQMESGTGSSGPSSGSGYVVQPGASPVVVVGIPRGLTSRARLGLVVSDQLQ